jgi:hypothetical protein
MRMLGPPTPDTRTPTTVGATPALTSHPTTCTRTITPSPTPAHSLPRSQTRRRPSPTALSHHRPPRFCVPASQPAPDPNHLLLSPARTPHSLPPPSRPRPTSRPAPSTPSVTPASAGGTLSPDSRTPLRRQPHQLRRDAPTRGPQAPQSSPLVRCPHRPFSPAAHRRPQPDQRNLTHRQGPNGMRLSRCAERAKRAERSRLEARVSPPAPLMLPVSSLSQPSATANLPSP